MNYRNSHIGCGEDYHNLFLRNGHRAALWRIERELLLAALAQHEQKYIRHLDFACGTGRVLSFLEPRVGISVGVDVSESMLSIARSQVTKATILNQDITRSSSQPPFAPYNLITAFRFFPNAEHELRQAALSTLRSVISPDGILILNNHLRYGSAAHRAEQVVGCDRKRRMRDSEVKQMLENARFIVNKVYLFGRLPFTERFHPLPSTAIYRLEALLARLNVFNGLAQTSLYIAAPI